MMVQDIVLPDYWFKGYVNISWGDVANFHTCGTDRVILELECVPGMQAAEELIKKHIPNYEDVMMSPTSYVRVYFYPTQPCAKQSFMVVSDHSIPLHQLYLDDFTVKYVLVESKNDEVTHHSMKMYCSERVYVKES